MDRYISSLIRRYYSKLSLVGYAKDAELMRLLAVIAISDFTSRDYKGFLRPCDHKVIERALYNLVGGCALPYPKINNTTSIMKKLHLGDVGNLADRIDSLNEYLLAYTTNNSDKQRQQDKRLDILEDEHNIEHPEYGDDEEEYGAKMKKRDAAHASGKHCRPHKNTKRGKLPFKPQYDDDWGIEPFCPCNKFRRR